MSNFEKSWVQLGDSQWAKRVRENLLAAARPVVVEGPPEYGLEYVLASLHAPNRTLLWVHLDDLDEPDLTSQGVRLAEAIAQRLGAPLIGFGLPLPEVTRQLLGLHELFGPFSVVLSGSSVPLAVLPAARQLVALGSSFVFHVVDLDECESFTDDVALVRAGELCLFEAEAAEVLSGVEPRTESPSSGFSHASMPLMTLLSKHLTDADLDTVLVPTPTGARMLGVSPEQVKPRDMAQALLSRGKPIEAFELLARSGEVVGAAYVDSAGQEYARRGLLTRAHRVFSQMRSEYLRSSDSMMRWYFAAATAANEHIGIRDEFHSYLSLHEAPELRALYAAAFPGPEFIQEARRAADVARTPTTLRIRAFAESIAGSAESASADLHAALRLSEQLGDHSQVVASATNIADLRSREGAYREAISWAEWALSWYWRTGCGDELRRLAATSMLYFNQVLGGGAAADRIPDLEVDEALAGVPTAEAMLTTAAEIAFVRRDLERSERLFRVVHDAASLPLFSGTALDLVRVLRERGAHSEATRLGEAALSVSRDMTGTPRACGLLANGIAMLDQDVGRARRDLQEAVEQFQGLNEAPRLAQATIALAMACLRLDDVDGVEAAWRLGARALTQLGPKGWVLCGGYSSEVDRLRRMYSGDIAELDLRFLGGSAVRFMGQTVTLGVRQCEVLVALALNQQQGVSAERLGLLVYGDRAQFSTIKAIVSRLRRVIPVGSKPYRLGSVVSADFRSVEDLIAAGKVREAVALYRGQLLPGSEAPIVVELRDHLEEMVRAAAVGSGDVDSILMLAEVLPDDPEILDVLLDQLAKDDVRVALVQARRRRIARDWERE